MTDFTKEDIDSINLIIDEYRSVSLNLSDTLKEAEEIKKKVNELKEKFNDIKQRENELMKNLHIKYGDFSLQDVYDILNNGFNS